MRSQMAFTKGVLGTPSRGTKLDFSGKLPEEMFAIFLYVHIEILLIILFFYLSLGEEGISLLNLLSSVSLKCHVLNGQ